MVMEQGKVVEQTRRHNGTIMKWNREDAYGFIREASNHSTLGIFAHITEFQNRGRTIPRAGDQVTFDLKPSHKGPDYPPVACEIIITERSPAVDYETPPQVMALPELDEDIGNRKDRRARQKEPAESFGNYQTPKEEAVRALKKMKEGLDELLEAWERF